MNLSKYSYQELSNILMDEIKETVKAAKRRGIITGGKLSSKGDMNIKSGLDNDEQIKSIEQLEPIVNVG